MVNVTRQSACILAVVALACADSNATSDAETSPDAAAATSSTLAESYAPELGVDLSSMRRTDSGLLIRDVQEGTGDVLTGGQNAVVHYTGYLPDGTKFDSSRDRDEPFTVAVGAGQVIDGWDEGLPGMKVGGQRRLVLPPDFAYGARGAGNVIPPNATLVFDVELLDVK